LIEFFDLTRGQSIAESLRRVVRLEAKRNVGRRRSHANVKRPSVAQNGDALGKVRRTFLECMANCNPNNEARQIEKSSAAHRVMVFPR